MARKAEREEKKKSGELSVHVPVNENLLRQSSNVVEILEPYTNNVVTMRKIFNLFLLRMNCIQIMRILHLNSLFLQVQSV